MSQIIIEPGMNKYHPSQVIASVLHPSIIIYGQWTNVFTSRKPHFCKSLSANRDQNGAIIRIVCTCTYLQKKMKIINEGVQGTIK